MSTSLTTLLTDAVIDGLTIGEHVTFRGGDLLEEGKRQYRTTDRPIPAVQSLGG